jgi:FixJ family two-component response regulator
MSADVHTRSSENATVHVVDDDDGFRRGLLRLLGTAGLHATGYSCVGEPLLRAAESDLGGCILLDLTMPGPNGLEFLKALVHRPNTAPVIIVTGKDDVCTSVEAMKQGAMDYIVKPVAAGRLLPVVRNAIGQDMKRRRLQYEAANLRSRFETLTQSERTVFFGAVGSRLNKQLAVDLNSCERTVKTLRARMMEKVHVRSIPELVRAARILEKIPKERTP